MSLMSWCASKKIHSGKNLTERSEVKSGTSLAEAGQSVIILPVEAPMAPMRIAGTAKTRHPNEAKNDNTRAMFGVLHDNTR